MTDEASEPSNLPPPRLRQMQEGDPHRGGNVLVLVGDEGEAQVLKIYRRRGTRAQEWSRALSHRFIEGKRGAGARARRDTERLCLTLWAEHGFDVFKVFDLPPPSWIAHPTLWIEYCPGRSLLWAMLDASVPWERKLGWLRRLASDMARRHALALRLGEPLLVQEHGTVNHVLVSGERLVPFDFEVAYRRGYPVMRAVSTELGGYLRSIQKATADRFPEALSAFAEGYEDRALLRRVAEDLVRPTGLVDRLRRRSDLARRGARSKTQLMEQLLATLPELPA